MLNFPDEPGIGGWPLFSISICSKPVLACVAAYFSLQVFLRHLLLSSYSRDLCINMLNHLNLLFLVIKLTSIQTVLWALHFSSFLSMSYIYLIILILVLTTLPGLTAIYQTLFVYPDILILLQQKAIPLQLTKWIKYTIQAQAQSLTYLQQEYETW